MKQFIGAVLISLPVLGIIGFSLRDIGVSETLKMLALVAFVITCVFAGTSLIVGG